MDVATDGKEKDRVNKSNEGKDKEKTGNELLNGGNDEENRFMDEKCLRDGFMRRATSRCL